MNDKEITGIVNTYSITTLKQIKQIKNDGAEWLVLETTSHALAQNRVWGIRYTMAVLTNPSIKA